MILIKIFIKTIYSKEIVRELKIDRLLNIIMNNLLRFNATGIIISILFLLNNKVSSTPTTEDGFFEKSLLCKIFRGWRINL